jgi:hypothetical protein
LLKITRPQLKQIIKEELLTEKDECHPRTVSSGWIDDEGVYTPLPPGQNHRDTATAILKKQYGKKRWMKWGAEAELVRHNWIKVSNWFALYGLHPSKVPPGVWIKQYMTIINKTLECKNPEQKVPQYYIETEQIVNPNAPGHNSYNQGADTFDRYINWLKPSHGGPGSIARSMTAMFREDLTRIIEEELEAYLNEKAVSKKQQRFMGMVYKCKETGDCASEEVKKAAASIKKKDAKDFASTKHKGLPEKKKEK